MLTDSAAAVSPASRRALRPRHRRARSTFRLAGLGRVVPIPQDAFDWVDPHAVARGARRAHSGLLHARHWSADSLAAAALLSRCGLPHRASRSVTEATSPQDASHQSLQPTDCHKHPPTPSIPSFRLAPSDRAVRARPSTHSSCVLRSGSSDWRRFTAVDGCQLRLFGLEWSCTWRRMTDCDPHDLASRLTARCPLSRPPLATLSVAATGARLPLTPRSRRLASDPAQALVHSPTTRQRHGFPDRGCLSLPATSLRTPLALSDAWRQPFEDPRIPLGRHVVGRRPKPGA